MSDPDQIEYHGVRKAVRSLALPVLHTGHDQRHPFPKSVSVKTSRTASLPGGKGFHANPDVYLISSDCAKRGKTQQELEKRLKEEGMI